MGKSADRPAGAVLFSAHPWNGFPYGLHHVASALAERGHAVLFVEPPFSPLHLALGRRRGRRMSARPRPSGEPGIWLFSPFPLLAYQDLPLLRSRFWLDRWPRLCLNPLAAAVRGGPFERAGIVISGSALFSSLALAAPAGLRAFRLADDERLFDRVPPAMRERTMLDLPRYDTVFATSGVLAAAARRKGARRVVVMPNGFDPKHFAGRPAMPPGLAGIAPPRIVYVGTLEAWFDWQAVVAAAAAMPQASFVLVGPAQAAPSGLPANVHLAGPRPHAEVPAWLGHCDVGIVPFRRAGRREALAAVDPIKLWEYLAAGLPVVASGDLDLPDLPGAVRPYGSQAGFVAQLQAALAGGREAAAGLDLGRRTWPAIVEKALAEAAA